MKNQINYRSFVFFITIFIGLFLNGCTSKKENKPEALSENRCSFKMENNIVFSDDFSDGIWAKFIGNPVIVRDQLWAESHYICEPSILFVDGLFRMWFSQMFPANGKTALGYATSRDGFKWIKHTGNPVLALDSVAIHRPFVMRHAGTYYCYAVDDEYGKRGPATMRRWSSDDGVNWSDERLVMTPTQQWENNGLCNMTVIAEDNGRWQMLYTSDSGIGGKFGYAWSEDGLKWTKYEGNPVIRDLYGGDPFLVRIGEWFYTWHSELLSGGLRIVCRCSRDMVNWEIVGGRTQINYTQLWEREFSPEVGGTADSWYGHITDATMCEVNGRVFLVYQGAQTPLGVATFDGNFTELAERLQSPPLSRWEPSGFGMVEGGVLRMSDIDSERNPLVAKVTGVSNSYILQARIQCYAGPTHRVSVVMRYANTNTFARFWLHDTGQVFYQECLNGLFSLPAPVGRAPICDDDWHEWEVEVCDRRIQLRIDKRPVGHAMTSEALMRASADHPVHIGFSTHDTWASIDNVVVRTGSQDIIK